MITCTLRVCTQLQFLFITDSLKNEQLLNYLSLSAYIISVISIQFLIIIGNQFLVKNQLHSPCIALQGQGAGIFNTSQTLFMRQGAFSRFCVVKFSKKNSEEIKNYFSSKKFFEVDCFLKIILIGTFSFFFYFDFIKNNLMYQIAHFSS